MNKSLAPLIIFLGVVLLVTVALVNARKNERSFKLDPDSLPTMKLDSLSSKPVQRGRPEPQNIQEFAPIVHRLMQAADRHLKDGRTSEAEDCLKTVITLQPDNYIATATLSELYFIQGKHRESEALFRNLARINPDNFVVYNNISIARACQGKVREALSYASKAAGMKPDSGSVLLNLAAIHSVLKNTDEAIKNFKAAYEALGPDILPLAFDPTFDNIRDRKEFETIVREAKKRRASVAPPEAKIKKQNGEKNEQNQSPPRTNQQ